MKPNKCILTILTLMSMVLMAYSESVNSGTFINMGTISLIRSTLENKDTIYNKGQILIDSNSYINSNGGLDNQGKIHSRGIFYFLQSSMDGEVIYESRDAKSIKQIIPANYYTVRFLGDGRKSINENKPLIARNLFYTDSTNVLNYIDVNWTNVKIIIKDSIYHDGMINPTNNLSYIIMDGSATQTMMGKGRTNYLELNNTLGADIIDTTSGNIYKDGMHVSHLSLVRGQLRNKDNANITIDGGNSSGTITRTALGSLAVEPILKTKVDLEYVGSQNDGLILTQAEIPQKQRDSLNDFHVNNVDGVRLTASATVNNKITVGSQLYTYEKDLSGNITYQNELTLNSKVNPVYPNDSSEIHGKLTRINFDPTQTIVFNNRYTFAKLLNPVTSNVKKLSFNVKPGIQYAQDPYKGNVKVARQLKISADSTVNGTANTNLALTEKVETTFGWRHNGAYNETFTDGIAKFNKLIFQYWNTGGLGAWVDNKSSKDLKSDTSVGWAKITADINELGDFTVGFPASSYLELVAKVVMEGPYRYGSLTDDLMFTDLRDSNRIPATPPNIYPYNLDANRATYNVSPLPPDVVDWVVVEFRDKDINPTSRFFRTCFLKKDGRLVDVDGISDVTLSKQLTSGMDTTGKTPYYVAVRHRNHVTLMSQNTVSLTLDAAATLLDFSNPSFVFGGNNSLKYVGYGKDQKKVFAMLGGNYGDPLSYSSVTEILNGLPGIDEITESDKMAAWDFMNSPKNSEGYLVEDYDLNGIITTRDFNISWNNRGRIGSIK